MKVSAGFLRIMRRACLAVAGVVVLAFVGLSAFLGIVDMTPRAEAFLTQALGKPVMIKGGVSTAMIGIMPGVEVKDVYFDGWSADEVQVTVPFWRKAIGGAYPLLLDIEKMSYRKSALGDLGADVTFKGGKAIIKPSSSEFLGGDLSGKVMYDGQKLDVNLSLDDADGRRLFPDYKGRIDAKAVLNAVGADSEDILRSLSGKVDIIGGEGALTMEGVNFWTADLLPVLMGGKKDGARLNCLVGRFNVRNGVASDRNILIDTDQVTVHGRGGIDFRQQKIHFLLTPKSKGANLASLATPIRISGGFDRPDIYPDPAGAAVKIGSMLLGAANPAVAAAALVYKSTDSEDVCKAALDDGQVKP